MIPKALTIAGSDSAIENSLDIGKGHGPLSHFINL
jgi:hydroxymethylpyrimidine/phosphomethylpyrimidine kinase